MATGNDELVSEQSLMTTRHNRHSGDKSGNDEKYTIISCVKVKGAHKRNKTKTHHRLVRHTDSDIAKNSQHNE